MERHALDCFNILQKLRDELGTDVPVQQAQILMLVAVFPDIVSKDLCSWLNMLPAGLSRNIKRLSQYKGKDGQIYGYNLMEARPSLDSGRQFSYRLTDKGVELIKKLGLTVKEGGDVRLQKG